MRFQASIQSVAVALAIPDSASVTWPSAVRRADWVVANDRLRPRATNVKALSVCRQHPSRNALGFPQVN